MTDKKAFDLTSEQVMAQLTPEETKGCNLSLSQMTPAAQRFVYLLAQERIEKAALLAACKLVMVKVGFYKTERSNTQVHVHVPPNALTPEAAWACKAAIEQAGDETDD